MDIFDYLFEKSEGTKDSNSAATRLLEEVHETRAKTTSDVKQPSGGQVLTKNVEGALAVVGALPDGKYDLNGYLFKGAMSLAGDEVKNNASAFLKGVDSINKTGSRIEMDRKGELKFDINQDVA
jgi:hypothetical protein